MKTLIRTRPYVIIVFIFSLTVSMKASAEEYNNATTAIRFAGLEFAKVKVEGPSSSLPAGFTREEDIIAGPGVRAPHFAKSYGDNTYDYAFVSVGIFNERIVFKLFQVVQDDKTQCMNTTVKTVEHLQKQGVTGWKKNWREDYQVAQWKAYPGKYKFSVTCRMREGIWLFEETRGLSRIK